MSEVNGTAVKSKEAGPKPKENGRIATLEKKVDTLTWLHAEMMHHMKMMVAQQLLSTPEVQDRLRDALVSQMKSASPASS